MRKAASHVYHPVHLDGDYLTGKALDRFERQQAKFWRTTSSRQRDELRELFGDEITPLQECLATGSPVFLADFACRADARLTSRHYPEGITDGSLAVMEDLITELPADYREQSTEFIHAARTALKQGGCQSIKTRLSAAAREFLRAALAGDDHRCDEIVDTALSGGKTVPEVYEQIFVPVLVETGRLWEQDKATIAQEHHVTALISRLMGRVHDRAYQKERGKRRPGIVTACVGSELHEIGIRMVADHLRADGWEVYHVGANAPARIIAETVGRRKAGVAALSVTMAARLPDLDYLIRVLRAENKTRDVKIIVGGYPFRLVPDLWKMIGADAVAGSAKDAPAIARRLVTRTG
jgi:methanogenic corrinoid protein MtbC1